MPDSFVNYFDIISFYKSTNFILTLAENATLKSTFLQILFCVISKYLHGCGHFFVYWIFVHMLVVVRPQVIMKYPRFL